MTNPDNPQFEAAIIQPTSVTHTENGEEWTGNMYATSDEAAQKATEHFAEVMGTTVYAEKVTPDTSTGGKTIGFGGTKWNAKWTPSGDMRREAERAMRKEQALQQGLAKGPQGNPQNN